MSGLALKSVRPTQTTGRTLEIAPGIHTIPSRMSRMYLVEDESLTLIDAGLPWDVRTVFRYVESIGRRPEDIDAILLTHNHPDHTSGARSISKRANADVIAHEDDTRLHHTKGRYLGYMGMFNATDLPLPFLRRTTVSQVASDGDVLPIAGGIQVIHTPGHTPGSACYLLKERGVIFTGDTAFSNGKSVSRSIPFPGYDHEAYCRSLEKLAEMDFDVMCGGHGRPLLGNASEKLRQLLSARPEPPTWADLLLRRLPGRISRGRSLSEED